MSRLPSVMNHAFAQVPKAEIPRSTFNRSHGLKTTLYGDNLTPIFVDEALPGDTFNLKAHIFARLATPIKPIMDNIYFDTFYFAVPLRLVWQNFQRFMGEQDDPDSSTDYLIPTVTAPSLSGWSNGSLADHLGIPTKVTNLEHSALFHRAYRLIYNTWFRDQNLQDSLVVPIDDGPDSIITISDYNSLKKRNKKRDYFTSSLPWPQKSTAVEIPLGSTAPVISNSEVPQFRRGDTTDRAMNIALIGGANTFTAGGTAVTNGTAIFGSESGLEVDLDSATAGTINELRQAFQLQRLFERDARGGTRYTEIIRAHFGVTSPDARLQRPEYLGGNSTPININPIAQTSESSEDSPQGNLAAMGTMSSSGTGFIKSFTEHTIIIGLAAPRADITYQQGLNKMFSRSTKYDFFWPALAHLGEQAVFNKEIYAQGNSTDEEVFGYQERYAEYRYKPSVICGQFRSNDTTPLDIWHMAEDYSLLPELDNEWIEGRSPWDRIQATTGPDFLVDCYFDLKCTRPMPVYSVPGMVDHF